MTPIVLWGVLAMLVQVKAQTGMITNCTSYPNYSANAHTNVPGPDCTSFYKCDNFGLGKLSVCGEGTLFNYKLGLCTTDGVDCAPANKAGCYNSFNQFQPSAKVNVPSPCCRNYWTYTCAQNTVDQGNWEFKRCSSGQIFDPSARVCVNGNTNCASCGPTPITDVSDCTGSNVKAIDNCTFSLGATGIPMPCPYGTRMNFTTCRCDLPDTTGVCNTLVGTQECDTWYLASGNNVADAKPISADYNAGDLASHKLSFFNGNGLTAGTTTQTFNLVVSLATNFSNELSLMSQSCMSSEGMSVELKLRRTSSNQVTAAFAMYDQYKIRVETTTSSPLLSVGSTLATFEFNIFLRPSNNAGKRTVSGTVNVNNAPTVVSFNSVDFSHEYWFPLKKCPLTVGDSGDNQFKNSGGRVVKFFYRVCKK